MIKGKDSKKISRKLNNILIDRIRKYQSQDVTQLLNSPKDEDSDNSYLGGLINFVGDDSQNLDDEINYFLDRIPIDDIHIESIPDNEYINDNIIGEKKEKDGIEILKETNEKKEDKNNENNIINLKNIYTPLFNFYNNVEELIKKNMTKLDNVRELYQEEGKIKWNKLFLNKRKNEKLKLEEKVKNNLKWLEYFSEINFINDIVNISDILRAVPRERRDSSLKDFILLLNKEYLPSYIYNPLSFFEVNDEDKLLRIDDKFSYPISTNERVPSKKIFEYSTKINNNNINKFQSSFNNIKFPLNNNNPNINENNNNIGINNNEDKIIYPETAGIFKNYNFNELQEIILNKSKYRKNSNYPNRKIISSIIKGGDELRQDFFISQILNLFNDFFSEEGLNIHLKTFNVISNSSGGFLQTIINSVSIAKINKITFPYEDKYSFESVSGIKNNNLNYYDSNLKNYFIFKFGKDSEEFKKAITNFVSSFVGYSLICYFFEIKDRNNGNILIDEEGNVIHIDFGFLLDKTPGNIKFERAPFKFTNDFIELIGGIESNYFFLFQDLFFKGFKIIRKNYDTVILMVELFCDIYHDLNSFHDKDNILKILKDKFLLAINKDEELLNKCNELINNSINNWRTKVYDNFQKYCVGIN